MAFPSGGYTSVANALTDGVIMYWPINETSGEVIRDYGPFGRHFDVWNDASNTSLVTGKFGNARELTVQNGTIKFESTPLTGHTTYTTEYDQITLSFWINIDDADLSTSYDIIYLGADAAGKTLIVRVDGSLALDRLYFRVGNSSPYVTGSTYLDGTWLHVVMTMVRTGSTSGTLNVYLNNTNVITDYEYYNPDALGGYFRPEFARNMLLSYGAAQLTTDAIGIIDDIGIWSRVLTGAEITQIYNSGTGTQLVTTTAESDLVGYFPSSGYTDMNDGETSGLVSYYPLNEASGTSFACYGAIAKPGVVYNDVGDATIVTGKFSNARDGIASGTGTTVLLLAAENSDYQYDSYGVTVSLWTNLNSADNSGTVSLMEISSLQYSSSDFSISYIGSTGAIQIRATSFFSTSDVSTTLNGSWHHLLITVREEADETQDARVWLDGADISSGWQSLGSSSKLFKPWYRTTALCCSNSWQTDYHLDGAVDDVGIWLRPLTAEDKTRIYNSGTGVALAQSTAYVRTVGEFASDSFAMTEAVYPPAAQYLLLSELATIIDYPYELGTTVYESLSDLVSFLETILDAAVGNVDELVQDLFSATDLVSSDVIIKLADIIRLQGSVTPGQILHLAVTDSASFIDALGFIYKVLLQESIVTTDTAALAYILAETVEEQITLNGGVVIGQVLNTLIATALAVSDSALLTFPKSLSEILSTQDAVADRISGYMEIMEVATLTDSSTTTMSLFLTVDEDVSVDDTLVSTGILNNLVAEALSFTLLFSTSEDVYVGWVMNTANQGVTTYSNYAFNSFAKVGSTYLAANSTGLYKLEGDDDAGVPIDAIIQTGKVDVGNGSQTRVEKAYLGILSDGRMVLKTITGDQIERWYESPTPRTGNNTLALTLGKGVKSRYWQFELNNIDGADFELEDIELLPVVLNRR